MAKKQLKNRKLSLAMKKSWAERRNSPMREQARERQAKKELAKLNEFIPRKGPKKVTQRVTKLPDGVVLHEGGGKFRTVPWGGVEHLEHFAKQSSLANERMGCIEAEHSELDKLVRLIHMELRALRAAPKSPGVRRMIATHMLAGMLASPWGGRLDPWEHPKVWAKKAYEFADALIEAEGA
jgi:hypothetical protein